MEIKINQDIRNFKTKDIGMFSFKEFLWLVLAVALGIVVFIPIHAQFPDGDLTIQLLPSVLVMAIPLIFGFGKFYGLKTMDFIRTVIIENSLSPPVLKYVPIQKESVTWKYVPIENRKLGMETKGFKLKFKNREIEKEKDYENEKTIEN